VTPLMSATFTCQQMPVLCTQNAPNKHLLYTVPGNLFVSFDILRFITKLFIAVDANSAY